MKKKANEQRAKSHEGYAAHCRKVAKSRQYDKRDRSTSFAAYQQKRRELAEEWRED